MLALPYLGIACRYTPICCDARVVTSFPGSLGSPTFERASLFAQFPAGHLRWVSDGPLENHKRPVRSSVIKCGSRGSSTSPNILRISIFCIQQCRSRVAVVLRGHGKGHSGESHGRCAVREIECSGMALVGRGILDVHSGLSQHTHSDEAHKPQDQQHYSHCVPSVVICRCMMPL